MATEGKVKFTEAGAAALEAWRKRSGVTLVQMAEVMGDGAHAMTATRALKLQAQLTLMQVGRLIAYARGELTAEMLVGLARASAVPVLPMRAAPAPAVAAVVAVPGAALGVPTEADEDGPPGIEELRRLGRKGLRRLEATVDDANSAATAAAESAYRLVKNWIAAEALEREKDKASAVKEVDLIQKFETLLFHARRAAAEEEKAAAPAAVQEPEP
jgi:hypothetical protein